MTDTIDRRPAAVTGLGHPTAFARRRPLLAFLVLAFGTGWPALTLALVADLPAEPFLLFLSYVSLLGSAVLVTRVTSGPGATKRLLSRLLVWRFGLGRWAVILFAVPAMTLAVAGASGTLQTPRGGWDGVLTGYLTGTVALCLLVNLWEETGWGGFTQSRLTARHGLLVGALLTAPLFAGIHLPLQLMGDPSRSEVLVGTAVLFAVSPFYRYLLGVHLLETGGSILAIALQHASWNTAGSMDGVDGWWQAPTAVVLLTLFVELDRRLRRPGTRPVGRAAEQAAAARWTAPRGSRTATEA